ncbi:MAG: twin-arginine translocase subunit TatC [Nitrospirae bacterium]|nr:twin-arginine translocase subunit TatC [Nitrospirota bacterium]
MSDRRLPLVEHLAELRRRLIICLASIFIFALLSYFYAQKILALLMKAVGKLVFIAPQEAFIAYLKIALFAGLFLSLPVILYQIWQFVSAGLLPKERKYLLVYGPLSFFLFLIGATFSYQVVLPLGLKFLIDRYSTATLQPMISISKYISFVGMFLLAFGVVFELPLIVLFLVKIGLVSPQSLRRRRREVIVLTFILAAVMTPPDIFTQFLLAVPILLLYEISLWTAVLVHKKRTGI